MGFPTAPAVGEVYTSSKNMYKWNGTAWDIEGSTINGALLEAPVDGTPYARQDAGWVPASTASSATLAPTLSGPVSANENTSVTVTIDNYSSALAYVVTPSVGTTTISGGTISWALPSVTVDTAATLSVTAEEVGISTVSSATVHNLNVLNVPAVADQALVYDSASMAEFSTLTNTTIDANSALLAGSVIDTTNIITDYNPTLQSTVDILGDGSCIALYEFEGNANDTSGTYNGTATGVTYGVGKFGQAGVFDGASYLQSAAAIPSTDTGTFTLSVFVSGASFLNNVDAFILSAGNLRCEMATGTASNFRVFTKDSYYDYSLSAIGITSAVAMYHIVFISNGGVPTLYVDNIQQAAPTLIASATGSVPTSITIGARYNKGLPWSGSIDQVRIFNRALTASEVTALYNESKHTLDTTTTTAGEIPSRVYKVDATPTFEIGTVNKAVKSADTWSGGSTTPLLTTRTFTDILDTVSSRTLRTKQSLPSDGKLTSLTATITKIA